MSIKAILAPIQGIDHDIHALRGAIRLAQAHDAHVTALFVHPTEEDFAITWARYGMVSPPVGLLAEIDHDTKQRTHSAGTLVEQAAQEFGVPIVTAGQEDVPPLSISLRITFPSQIVIAWSGSIEGAQAVTAALPFLSQADNVYAVRVGQSDYARAHDRMLVEYLRRHEVPAEVRVVEAGQHSDGTALLSAATDLQADLLVMGGYTHGPVRQRVFGGVTRHVLKHASVPVLMVH